MNLIWVYTVYEDFFDMLVFKKFKIPFLRCSRDQLLFNRKRKNLYQLIDCYQLMLKALWHVFRLRG